MDKTLHEAPRQNWVGPRSAGWGDRRPDPPVPPRHNVGGAQRSLSDRCNHFFLSKGGPPSASFSTLCLGVQGAWRLFCPEGQKPFLENEATYFPSTVEGGPSCPPVPIGLARPSTERVAEPAHTPPKCQLAEQATDGGGHPRSASCCSAPRKPGPRLGLPLGVWWRRYLLARAFCGRAITIVAPSSRATWKSWDKISPFRLQSSLTAGGCGGGLASYPYGTAGSREQMAPPGAHLGRRPWAPPPMMRIRPQAQVEGRHPERIIAHPCHRPAKRTRASEFDWLVTAIRCDTLAIRLRYPQLLTAIRCDTLFSDF